MTFPLFHTNAPAWNRVKIGGHLVLCVLREVDGIKLEGDWSEQKPTGSSGASWNWKGLKPAGPHKLTFETAYGPGGITPEACERDMYIVLEMMLPAPSGTAATATKATPTATPTSPTAPATPTTAEGLLQQAQQALKNLDNPAKAADPTAGTTGSDGSAKKDAANPGPRPPTLSIENGFLNRMGTLAGSYKSFEIKPTKTNSLQFILEVVPQKPLVAAGTGLAPAKSPDVVGTGGSTNASGGSAGGQAAAAEAQAVAAGSGT